MNVENLKARSAIIRLIRRWFDERGFLEMHTPRLVGLPGQEPHLEPFWTEVHGPNVNGSRFTVHGALITSPEYMMKRLVAEGFDKIYDLGPCFRNGEPWDGTHDPEFLLLECYRRDAGIEDLMRDTEEMVKFVGASRHGGTPEGVMNHAPTWINAPFRRLTVEEAWKKYANIELASMLGDREAMAKACRAHGQTVTDSDTWDDLYFKIFLSEIEPKLGWADHPLPLLEKEGTREISPPPAGGGARGGGNIRPTFLYRYPASQAALARRSADDPRWADRVELYIGGLELANGFAELSDPVEQRKRFEEEQALRQKLVGAGFKPAPTSGPATWPIDEKFLATLPKMGNAAGMAFGVDRFVMLLTGATSINDVVPFPARERFGS